MDVSTREAFSLFRRWKSNGTVLRVSGMFSEGLTTGFKGSVRISEAFEASGKVVAVSESGGEVQEFSFSGALFSVAKNSEDVPGVSFVLVVRPLEGGVLMFASEG